MKKGKSNKSLSIGEDLESHAFEGPPLESYIIYVYLFLLSLQDRGSTSISQACLWACKLP